MAKIVLIGAGSHFFARNIITDILSYPELQGSTITLVGHVHKEPVDLVAAFAKKMVKEHGFKTKIEPTMNRREALNNAGYILTAIRVGGAPATQADRQITGKYGVNESAGDTPGSHGRLLRVTQCARNAGYLSRYGGTLPGGSAHQLHEPAGNYRLGGRRLHNDKKCRDMQRGTEHSRQPGKILGIPIDELSYRIGGINHMAWFLELKRNGKDMYPLLKEKFKDPAVYSGPNAHVFGADIVRAEVFKAFGYYCTETSPHLSEYLPYFRKRPELIERFKLQMIERTPEEREKMRRANEKGLGNWLLERGTAGQPSE